MSRAVVLALLAVCLASVRPDTTLAWGAEGHKIVCEIAWQRLSPEARAFVNRLRAADPEPGASFAESCTWADKVRETTHRATSQYHYVNLPPGADGFEPERDCPAYDCVAAGIRRYTVYLARDDADDEDRAEALKFLAHFVGDVHQPLHAGYREDRGGNDIWVDWFGDPALTDDDVNLHAVWDRRILIAGRLFHPRSALELDAETSLEEAAAWRTVDTKAWIDDSYRLAAGVAYRLPEDHLLRDDYLERSLTVVRRQLKKAGVRLAFLLSSIVDGSLPAEP